MATEDQLIIDIEKTVKAAIKGKVILVKDGFLVDEEGGKICKQGEHVDFFIANPDGYGELSSYMDKRNKGVMAKLKNMMPSFNMKDAGAGLMMSFLKKFMPKIKKMIEKNKPRAIAFMKGEIEFNGDPIAEGKVPEERVVILAYYKNPETGEEDVRIQVKTNKFTRIQTAKDAEGKDLSTESEHSLIDFANAIISGKAEEMIESGEFNEIMKSED